MLVSSLHATDRLTLGSFFELDLPKQIGHQPSQPRIFEPEFGNPVVGAARAIGLARVVGRDDCGLNPKQRFAPPVQVMTLTPSVCAISFRSFPCVARSFASATSSRSPLLSAFSFYP
jgi:hypothetical protein